MPIQGATALPYNARVTWPLTRQGKITCALGLITFLGSLAASGILFPHHGNFPRAALALAALSLVGTATAYFRCYEISVEIDDIPYSLDALSSPLRNLNNSPQLSPQARTILASKLGGADLGQLQEADSNLRLIDLFPTQRGEPSKVQALADSLVTFEETLIPQEMVNLNLLDLMYAYGLPSNLYDLSHEMSLFGPKLFEGHFSQVPKNEYFLPIQWNDADAILTPLNGQEVTLKNQAKAAQKISDYCTRLFHFSNPHPEENASPDHTFILKILNSPLADRLTLRDALPNLETSNLKRILEAAPTHYKLFGIDIENREILDLPFTALRSIFSGSPTQEAKAVKKFEKTFEWKAVSAFFKPKLNLLEKTFDLDSQKFTHLTVGDFIRNIDRCLVTEILDAPKELRSIPLIDLVRYVNWQEMRELNQYAPRVPLAKHFKGNEGALQPAVSRFKELFPHDTFTDAFFSPGQMLTLSTPPQDYSEAIMTLTIEHLYKCSSFEELLGTLSIEVLPPLE